ncbi:uncharacterized protein Nmag_2378 [Natrialba magadii ATCC 43099]|uniref:DUF7511 domain-containing protein n=1 Tax=Natrialba magadii (strain ATCC 43099 / DSM 3394 / CCM 3739 / CIP 104546 / IAM 13178 / JCM 8861 / NBRC 102185 / NCIMB 2190 / MS3) TaxID=547559 RepID=D3SXJ0_NATMM|nr:hypothetical protein [Natrialba magadii]ADD05939.1 uncharacterized protein Nmag_2378 [Natrialba magadii ATCC 43099]ELY30553.1 hypothetical protein C500_08527 [Natrialba magadii ATCC 43099]
MTDSYRERTGERVTGTNTDIDTDTDTDTDSDTETDTESASKPTTRPEHDDETDRRQPNARVLPSSPSPASASDVHMSSSDETRESDPRTALERIVVQYEDGPNQWTLVPQEGTAEERLTAWLSADEDLFVDRLAMR